MEQRKRLRRGRDLERSLTLLRVFLLASALICAGAGVALGSILSRSLTREALNAEQASLSAYVDGVVRPVLVHHGRVEVPSAQDGQLASRVMRQRDIVTVKVWQRSGFLAWTNKRSRTSSGHTVHNRDRRFIDTHRFPFDDELDEAIDENRTVAKLVGTGADGEDAFERNKLGYKQLFEVYAPIENKSGTRAIGAYGRRSSAGSTGCAPRCPRSSTTTSAGTGWVIRTACAATGSRSRPRSSGSRTRSTR